MPESRRVYRTGLSDAEWALLEPLPEKRDKRGRPPKWPRRLIADAMLYLLCAGCAWRLLPRGHPPWQTVCLLPVPALAAERPFAFRATRRQRTTPTRSVADAVCPQAGCLPRPIGNEDRGNRKSRRHGRSVRPQLLSTRSLGTICNSVSG
jgi:transposase